MSSFNIYDATVVYYKNGLKSLSHILKKTEEHCKAQGIPEKEMIEARLAPDMNPLPFQVQTACDSAKKTLIRLINFDPHPMEDNESTFAELQERISKTLTLLEQVKREDFDFDVEAEIVVKMGPGDMTFTKRSYVQVFAVPNFYFHAVTTYAILRAKGVQLGKTDWIAGGRS